MRVLENFVNGNFVPAGSAITLTAQNANDTVLLDTAGGSTVTLPQSAGDKKVYKFLVSVLATSNSHIIKVANTNDVIQGSLLVVDTDTAGTITAFSSNATSDTLTLNRSTTGSVTLGEWIEVVDLTAGTFVVTGVVSNTGTGATPFSATV